MPLHGRNPVARSCSVTEGRRPYERRHTATRYPGRFSPEWLARTTTSERPRWTLVGAGSLGSKLALHLARAGNGPEVVVDRSGMSPHNAARHALVPATGDMQILWMDAKARGLSRALRGLDQEATAVVADAAPMAMDRKRAEGAWSRKSWAVVNATASLAVREAFGASEWIRPRVVEASLFAGGRVGAVTVEGPGRNPSTTDLIAEFYAMLQEEPELSSMVFDDNEAVGRQGTGHGCGSLTMPMSDGRLSLSACRDGRIPARQAGERIAGRRRVRSWSGGSRMTAWVWRGERSRFRPSPLMEAKNGSPWRVHLHQRALSKMRAEAGRWPDAETGGVLMGRLSEVSRVAHVVDVLGCARGQRTLGRRIHPWHARPSAAPAGLLDGRRLVAVLPRNMAQSPVSGRPISDRPGDGESGVTGALGAVDIRDHDADGVGSVDGRGARVRGAGSGLARGGWTRIRRAGPRPRWPRRLPIKGARPPWTGCWTRSLLTTSSIIFCRAACLRLLQMR